MSNYFVMNQVAGEGPRAESPLYHADLATVAAQGPQLGGVVIGERALLGHLVLRGDVNDAAFTQGVEKVLGVALPGKLAMAEAGDVSIRWISPDEWLVLVPGERAFELEAALREGIDTHFAVVNGSGGQTVLSICGENAVDMLKKCTPYDLHDRNFPVGKVVTTVFAKTQAVITRVSEDTWELVIRRSFADYAWLWLQDASAEFGLVVKG